MKRFCFCLILLSWFGTASADEALSPDTLQAIKNATVYIKIEVAGQQASGSGFLVKVDGETGYIVTNQHVADPKLIIIPGKGRGPRAIPPRPIVINAGSRVTLTVVFGSGTRKEQALRAEVVTTDADRDLAILKVTGVKDAPAALDISQTPKLVETMQVYGFGFPFGKELATDKGNPEITVTRGAISSIRTNGQDEIARVQIDGALNPGDSGGPVVDAKGRLVGIVVSGIKGSGIAFAVPPQELDRMLQGRVGKSSLAHKKKDKDMAELDVSVHLIDPFGKIRGISVYYLPIKATESTRDRLDGVTGTKKLELKIDRQIAAGSFQVAIPDPARDALLWQTSYINGEGKTIFGKPQKYSFQTAPEVPPIPVVNKEDKPSGEIARVVQGNMFAFIQERVKEKRVAEVDITGFKLSKDTYRQILEEGGILIGFEVGVKDFFKKDIIDALRPIYLTKNGEKLGEWQGKPPANPITVKAKPGYAVAGVNIRSDLFINGFSVSFMKLGSDRLLVEETYTSPWIGSKEGSTSGMVGGAGYIFVGICGHLNNTGPPCSLGLITVLKPRE
jgi:hypothetical protein